METQRRKRIQVALWAYSYEIENDFIVSDEKFDTTCKEIDLTVDTGNELLDTFFREHFSPDTGMWVHNHPELDKLKVLYDRLKEYRSKESHGKSPSKR